MAGEQRRDARFPLQVAVTLIQRDGQITLITEDVGYRGVFLRTDSPPRMRQLMTLRIQLSPDELFTCHGMAVHFVGPGDPTRRVPGVGVQFYALDDGTRRKWNAFVERLQARHAAPPHAQTRREPIARKSVRVAARFVVRVRTAHDLHTFTTRDVSRAGMFLRTTERFEEGTALLLEVVHENRPPLRFEAVVRRCTPDAKTPGIGVELRQPDPLTIEALISLAETNQHDKREFVTEYDPQLE